MPTITIRLEAPEKAQLEQAARQAGAKNVSEYVRQTLALRDNQDQIDGLNARVEALWAKVARLEELAGL